MNYSEVDLFSEVDHDKNTCPCFDCVDERESSEEQPVHTEEVT